MAVPESRWGAQSAGQGPLGCRLSYRPRGNLIRAGPPASARRLRMQVRSCSTEAARLRGPWRETGRGCCADSPRRRPFWDRIGLDRGFLWSGRSLRGCFLSRRMSRRTPCWEFAATIRTSSLSCVPVEGGGTRVSEHDHHNEINVRGPTAHTSLWWPASGFDAVLWPDGSGRGIWGWWCCWPRPGSEAAEVAACDVATCGDTAVVGRLAVLAAGL